MRSFLKFKIQLLALAVLALLAAASPLPAVEVPPLKGRVNDYAEMLSPYARERLNATLAELERTDSTQIAVLTIPSLEGDSLEDFSIRVAEEWQIGQEGFDNGAILLVVRNDRKIRIEVGYGLEGKLTDLVSGRIIRNVIAPHFKAGQFDEGIVSGVTAMAGVVRGEYSARDLEPKARAKPGANPGLFGIFALIFLVNMLGRLHRAIGAVAGGLLFPILGSAFFGLGLLGVLLLIPAGIGAGLLISLMGGPLVFGPTHHHSRHHGGYWGGGFGGGGFGGGGFGGFSGGGGGFGGGGASGGW